MKITKIAAVFLVMAFSGKMMAQETEKQLLIKDADDKFPIADALVKYNQGNSHTHTGTDGTFAIPVKSLPDTLVISRQGYDEVKWVMTNEDDKIKLFFYSISLFRSLKLLLITVRSYQR
ncbi:hypothetical protein EJ377_03155 [Chryseobacterium arthrosphaerae]|uniref:Carboxypeptidase-like regulatory domain-containing protein n=1 Tax=Chryseobacterium arthrosphaerae TaxID=651561 RepID=A0A432DZ82_9FLAO|nr:hypothetical protein EJ377_03155 [Chryseobacterium arthrosphaerae]